MSEQSLALTGIVPDGQYLVASCFDAHHTIGGGLFAVNGTIEEIDRVSSTGLDVADGVLYRCLWSADGSPAELIAYDETGVRRYFRLDDVSAPHDILAVDGRVLVVATTQNEVQCIAPSGEVEWRWRAPGEPDSWHLNSLARWHDQIVVCGFGPFLRRRGWDESGHPTTGRVVSIATGEPVLDGLKAPHNPWYDGEGSWLICDSAEGKLVEISDATGEESRHVDLPGWPRGLAMTDRHLFVGVSPHRHMASSVETAGIAVVDRASFRLLGMAELPAREVYALALAPAPLVEGAAQAFGANHTRSHEQGQRRLFDNLGKRPRQFWAVGDRLAEDECHVSIAAQDDTPETVQAGALLNVTCRIRNTGTGLLTPAPPYPVRVVHRWYNEGGELVDTQPINAALPRSIPPGESVRAVVRARVPEAVGTYQLHITCAQDGGTPFDEFDQTSAVSITVQVRAVGEAYSALREFGLYPAELQAARLMSDTVQDLVRALLRTPEGTFRGLTIGLIEDAGRQRFADALATALTCSPASLDHIVTEALPHPGETVLLTGAEAIGLSLRRSGVNVVFGYAGTSELVICDAMARLGLLVNGRGDREALFAAGGASRLRPGNGAAVLHGARGLTNALGALADLRRNEVGTVAVVGLASTGSQPFLPPHGEPDLIPVSGSFAKSWHELQAVPEDPGERDAAVTALAEAVSAAVRAAKQPPCGPTLVAVPQDVAEAAWVPLHRLPRASGMEPAGIERREEAARSASALVRGARRPVVLIDDYALTHDGLRPALSAFSERTGAPVLQVKYRRGAMFFERLTSAEVPGFLGWHDPSSPAHQSLLAAADLLITVEDRNMYPRVIGDLPDCRKIALTSKPEAARKNKYLREQDVLLHADVVASLRELTAQSNRRDGSGMWCAEPGPEEQGPAEPVPPEAAVLRAGIACAISEVAGRTAKRMVLVDDSQMFGGMLAEEYDNLPPGLRVFGGHGGFVGSGITLATGLAVGEPSVKVLCCLGDQGFTNSLQGLVAAVQESAPVTYIVCNNGGSVSLRKQSAPSRWLDDGRDRYLENAEGMRYAQLASALGVHAQRLDLSEWLDPDRSASQLAALTPILADMTVRPGPTLIELVLPSDPEFWSGVWITRGFEQPAGAADAVAPAPVAASLPGGSDA